MDLEPPTDPVARAIVSWKAEGRPLRRPLTEGRYLVGDSAFAAIRLGVGTSLPALIQVSASSIVVRCLTTSPGVVVDGRRLTPGESILVGDILECLVGRHSLTISAASLSDPQGSTSTHRTDTPVGGDDPDTVKRSLARALLEHLNLAHVDLANIDSPEVRETARLRLRKLIGELQLPTNFSLSSADLEDQVFDEVLGLGPLESLLSDPTVTEIMVNRRDQIYLERSGRIELSPVSFSSDSSLMHVIERIVSSVGRRVDTSSPVVDARLLDGSRVNAVIPPLALNGPALTIRRFSKSPIRVDKLVSFGSMTADMATFLREAVHDRRNIVVSGGTGSGKTTLLNALSSFIPPQERIITIEDAAELQLQQDHVVRLEARPANLEGQGAVTIRDLVKNTLRMRPDRIIVGECRSGEALDMLQAMNTGHDGSLTTAHANTPEDMLRRLETMVMMAGMDLPLKAIREQIASAIHLVVQQTRRHSGRRLVTAIAWVAGLREPEGTYRIVPLFSRSRDDKAIAHADALSEYRASLHA